MLLAISASTSTPVPQPTINASTHASTSQAQLEESTRKTESVDSEAPAAPSSGIFESAPAPFSLERSYPSLFSIAKVMNGLSGSTDYVGFHNVTAMLISKANFVLKRVRVMPGLQNCQDPAYLFALGQVVSNFDLLCHQVDIIKDHPPQEGAGIPMALEMTETALYCLKLFVEAAEHLASQPLQFVEPEPVLEPQLEATPKQEVRTKANSRRKMKVLEQKPLPDIPREEPYNEYHPTGLRYSDTASSSKASLASESSDWNTSSSQSRVPSIITACTTPDTSPSVSPVEGKDSSIQVDKQFNQSTPTIVISSTVNLHYDSPSPIIEEGDGVTLAEATDISSNLLDVTAAVTPKKKLVASLFRLKTRFNSSTTLAVAGQPGYFFAFQKGSKEDMKYNPRQSALWFPEDPLHPEVDVDMPMPMGDAAAVHLNNCGEIKAGTLNSLIRMLTSKEGVTNHEFITFFFLGRTSFTTPVEFFDELVSRYMEREPTGLTEQQKRVWDREVNTTRIRVGKTMVLWVNEYWIPGIDVEVLERMQMFSDDIMAKDLPRDLVDTFNKLLQRRIDGDNKNHRKKKSLEAFSTTELWFPQEIPILTGFKMPKEILGDMYFKLRLFDSESGRDEFARQITMTVAGIFRKVEPEKIVMYWRLKEMGPEKPEEERKEPKKCDTCGEAKKNVRGPLPLIPEQIKKKEEEIIREEKERKRQEREKPLGEPEMRANADLQAMIDFESSLALWVTYTILKVHLAAHRAQVITFWLKVADKCLNYRNFSGANCIFSGVAHSSVTRLHETVLLVRLESKLIFHKLDRFFSGHGNYKEFRMVLNGPATPVVPLITPLVRDVLSVREMPIKTTAEFKGDTENKELISLCGYRIMMKTIRCLDNCRVPYNFSFEPVFQNWFASELSRWPPNQLNAHTDKFYARSNKRTEQGDDKRLSGLKISLVWMYICAGSGEWLGDDWVMQMIDPHMPMPTMDDKHKMAKLFSGMLGTLRRKKGSKVPGEKNAS
ncbi:ras guanine nucleotide exchange factor domain-containing protein [Crucibulum laeve]|uniref:Ras guanine nucleotide exchange factor domain-containing protein n=1 Tax=Crucibulum laeve TaxID=68775 RepID=A0A5C3M8R0_9AGAR|nr:ras guanine nucleotide exchange factor domain-containing protein [Crucibulum laeve]